MNETIKNLQDGFQKLIWLANSMTRDQFDEMMTIHNGRRPTENWLDGQWGEFRRDFTYWYANVDGDLQRTFIEMALQKYL